MWNSELNLLGLLALRAAAAVLGSWLVCRLLTSSRAKAMVWRGVPLSLLLMVLMEISGLGQLLTIVIDLPWSETPSPHLTAAPVTPREIVASEPRVPPQRPREAGFVAMMDTELSGLTPAAALPLTPSAEADRALPAAAAHPASSPPTSPAAAPGISVAWLWAAGAVVCLAYYLASKLCHGVFFFRRGTPVHEPVRRGRLRKVQRRLGMQRRVRLLLHSRINTPVAFGVLVPTIVVPRDFYERYRPDEQDAILAHELAHLMAGDTFWQHLSQLVTSLLWWHPAAWFAHQQLHLSIELAADEASLRLPGGPDRLADCLVKVGRDLIAPSTAGILGVSGRGPSALATRVRRLIEISNGRVRVSGSSQRGIALFMIFVLFSLSALLPSAIAGVHPSVTKGESPMQMLQHSWRQSLAAVAMASFLAPAAVVAEDETETVTITDDGQVEVVNENRFHGGEQERQQVEVAEYVITDEGGEGLRREVRIRQRRNSQADEGSAFDAVDKARRVAKERADWIRFGDEEVRQEIERLHRRLAELQRTAGREEAARAVQQRVRQRSSAREQHLRAAVENLHAAGLHELAAQAEARLREDAEMQIRPYPSPTRDFIMEKPTVNSSPQSPREVQQLRQQMQQMQHQMRTMERVMRELLEQREGRNRDPDHLPRELESIEERAESDAEERAEQESRR